VLRGRPDVYRRMSNIEPLFKEMGVAGVFSAEGKEWRPQRRLSMEALSHRHLRGFYATLRRIAERMKRRWEGAADRQDVLDITDDLKRFTVDVTTLLTFGHDVNTIEQGEGELQRRLELLFPAFHHRLFTMFPTWRYFRLPSDRRIDRALVWLRDWLRELVAQARASLAADPSRAEAPSNFLEAMLSARDEEGRPFSDETLFGNLMTMLLAGEDTTAYTLAWAVHELCDDPASVASLRAEADAVMKGGGAPPDIESANALSWAAAIAKETMRLRPVAPLLFHDTNVETVLGDVRLPARTTVVVLTRPAARAAESFDEPGVFRPGRWLGKPAGAHDASVHIPFGSGPRLCPGRTLAILEMNVLLATLYGHFDVTRVGATAEVHERIAFTMYPEGLKVRLRRR
jgi:cytochrome P450